MSFEEIIEMMANAMDYMDLYDAASYIVDDDLRVDVEQLIGQCEDDEEDIETAYSVVVSDLLDNKLNDLNESLAIDRDDADKISITEFTDDIQSASNDKDLINILDDMGANKNIDKEVVQNLRQLFRNNRFMPLDKKVDTLIRYINDNSNIKKQESLTEAVDVNDNEENDDKENESIDDKITDVKAADKKSDIEVSTLDTIKKRIGQQFDVGELNSMIQSIFGQYSKIFLMTSDLYSMNLDDTQTIEVNDDDGTYILSYDIIDMDKGIVELKDVSLKEV